MRRAHAMIALAACMLAAPALGQEAGAPPSPTGPHPMFLPTRDVAVTYRLTSDGQGDQLTHLYFSTAVNKLRIDTPGNGGYTVLDRGAGQRLLVMNQDRKYVALPLDPAMADGFVLNSTMSYRRGGSASVAGVPCTEWSVSSSQTTGSACVTDDGVLLRGEGRQQGGATTGLVATSVDYAPQPGDLFLPPGGFTKVDPSQLQGGPGPAGPGGQGGGPGASGGQ